MSRRKQARPLRLLEDEEEEGGTGATTLAASTTTNLVTDIITDENNVSSITTPPPVATVTEHHHDDPSQFSTLEQNCENSNSSEEEIVSGASGSLPPETHMCPRCHEQFTEMPEFLAHRAICDSKARRHHEPAHSDPEDMVVSGDEDQDEEDLSSNGGGSGSQKRLEEVRRHRQDAANNNNSIEDGDEDDANGIRGPLLPPFPVPAATAGHVTLEALQNTKVAVAQFAATALANNADNEAALQELAVLQSTLFTLQHQQVFQLQLINQLQQQLSINRPKDSDPMSQSPPLASAGISGSTSSTAIDNQSTTPQIHPASTTVPLPITIPQHPPITLTPPIRPPTQLRLSTSSSSPPLLRQTSTPPLVPIIPLVTPTSQNLPATHTQIPRPADLSIVPQSTSTISPAVVTTTSAPVTTAVTSSSSSSTSATPPPLSSLAQVPLAATQPPLCSISSSLASTIITNNDPPPSLDEPNTLEMLQRRAQEVLDNASQGLLASNLADELAFRKGKGSMSPYDGKSGRNEPFFKHRCRYCGKVFGSDSALQIHIRSHTGERPFKCNVCGSRFTTKGNLKVHFQRHTAKFPHIKMNPNPVPEHLDKYHPPLLAQLGQNRPVSPGMPPHPPPHPLQFPGAHHPFPLYRPPSGPHDLLPPRPLPSPQRPPIDGPIRALPPHPIFIPRRDEQEVPENLSKPPRTPSPTPSRDMSEPRCKSEPLDDMIPRPPSRRDSEAHSEDNAIMPKQEPEEADEQEQPETEINQERPFQSPTPTYDECSMESKYSNEEMMDHEDQDMSPMEPMEHDQHDLQDQPENLSMRGNTTCNICFKTFACNSALEIHYRSHTKERPFKCTVCDRGFSTKGNMKQHMLTHKIRDMPQHMFDKPPGGPGGLPLPPQSSILPPPNSIKEESRNSHGSIINIPERPERPENFNSCSSEPPTQILERERERERERDRERERERERDRDRERERDLLPPIQTQLLPPDMPIKPEMSLMKRSPPEAELPLPKRPPNLSTTPPSSGIALLRECVRFAGGGVSPIMQQQQQAAAAAQAQNQASNQSPGSQGNQQNTKHLCHVCNKNFSSSSALQIHMRTHTGDKPFRCNVCQKAFTTKGNLKVHMGTHMWSNGASRRGRRMSLDLPPIPMTPKDSEFLQRRPDLFYPYLPAPFLNGMQQKLNEISVIQNPGNGLPSPGKYASLLGFGYPPVSEPLRSQPSSPLSDKPPSSVASSPPRENSEPNRPPRDVLPRVWDLHYERQATTEEEPVSPSNGTINVPTPNLNSQLGVPSSTRGEGLAA